MIRSERRTLSTQSPYRSQGKSHERSFNTCLPCGWVGPHIHLHEDWLQCAGPRQSTNTADDYDAPYSFITINVKVDRTRIRQAALSPLILILF